ncbi:transketolase [Pendulispora brunnea]|uniref:Transketolase n=1 Tax=Pendulispora brunnea TaxID=2905690 RepID=A0ABZ2KKH0_9BACT
MLKPDPVAIEAWRARRAALLAANAADQEMLLRQSSTELRRTVIRMVERAGMGHLGGDLSVIDILATLFGAVLRLDPNDAHWPERDRFILSKGHSAAALYATLAACGYFAPAQLETFMAPLSALNGHPNRTKVPGVETNTGPLGHGLPVAVGCALAARMQGSARRTFVVLGDGELQEGSNWEAAMAAGHYELANLTAIVDRNRLQQGASTEETNRLDPLSDKWRSFGWEVREVDGHDHVDLLHAFRHLPRRGKPLTVIAHTVKGKGVSFMENRVEWHHKVPTAPQVIAALEELQETGS